MSKENPGVIILDTHEQAENAIKELEHAGFDLKKLSIIGKDYHTEEHVVGYYNIADRMEAWGKLGMFWGGIWGILVGSAFFFIPGFGPIIVGGPLVSAMVGGLEGAVMLGGVNIIAAGLYGLGIPKDSVVQYEKAIKAEKFLLVVHGSADELVKAEAVLKNIGHDVEVHNA